MEISVARAFFALLSGGLLIGIIYWIFGEKY